MLAHEYPVIARMESQLVLWSEPFDRRAIFLDCYTRMTKNMLGAVAEARFNDGAWVSSLLSRFAEYYFEALHTYGENADGAPAVWRVAFNAASQPGIHSMQHLFLGVNAHIRYDLVLTLVDMLREEWPGLTEFQRQNRYADHRLVNQIIYETINSVQDAVIERQNPEMDLIDKLMLGVDEWLIFRLISNWREETWHHAQHLMTCAGGASADPHAAIEEIEQSVVRHAEAILGQHGIRGLLDLL